jgi:uncharacterized protein (TIGR02246 family)
MLTPNEDKSLRELMVRLDEAWQARDFETYLTHFSDDADLVNRAGTWFKGKAQIAKQLDWLKSHGYPEMFTTDSTVAAIRSVAPGVATVHQRRFDGTRIKALATFVIVRRNGRWLVEALSIAPLEARQPPAK